MRYLTRFLFLILIVLLLLLSFSQKTPAPDTTYIIGVVTLKVPNCPENPKMSCVLVQKSGTKIPESFEIDPVLITKIEENKIYKFSLLETYTRRRKIISISP